MCFIIRILSPFHLDIQTMPILNLNCLKNAKSTWAVFHSSQLKWSLNCVVFASSVTFMVYKVKPAWQSLKEFGGFSRAACSLPVLKPCFSSKCVWTRRLPGLQLTQRCSRENDGNILRIDFFSGDVFSPFLEGLRVWLLLREASLRTSIVLNLIGMLECWSGHPQGCRLSSFSLQLATLCFKREA